MELTFEQIKSITVGAERVWSSENKIFFSKCTQKQTEAWYTLDKSLGCNSDKTTGIRFDFLTDSSTFAFVGEGGTFEIFVNGEKCGDITSDMAKSGYMLTLGGGTNRIMLLFPFHSVGCIFSVKLADCANIIPHKFEKKILFIGDSITQGWNSGMDSLSYAMLTSMALDVDSVIHGVGGGFFHTSIIDPDYTYDPDAIIVAFGCNDWVCTGKDKDTMKKNASDFFKKLRSVYGNKTYIAISPIHRLDASTDFDDACVSLREAIKENGFFLVDGYTIMPADRENYADDLHPGAKGFGIYAENLIKAIKDII